MADPSWGMLAKALDDPQTINEAITEAIAAHEADSEAHLGVGESLETHRAQDVIDHPAESIVPDKIITNFYSDQAIMSSFQSLDAFGASSYILDLEFGGVFMATTTVLNNRGYIQSKNLNVSTCDMDKNPQLDICIKATAQGTHDCEFGIGGIGAGFDQYFCGFYTDGVDLYGRIVNEDSSIDESVLLDYAYDTNFHTYSVKYIYGEGAYFYVDAVLVGQILDTSLDSFSLPMFFAAIKTTQSTRQAYLRIKPFAFKQDN